MGLFYSFSFYSFLYIVREVFRILSITFDYDLWILTDKEVDFYNLFFAFISVIFAQSVCFSFWFDRPRSIFEKRHYKAITIVNDQRVLNWYFLNWFSKLAVAFGIMFGLVYRRGFYTFSLYADYHYIFILIVIVLFLQTWNTLGLIFKRKGLKLMLLVGVILSTIAFGLSKINLIDYKSINEICLARNIDYNYNLRLPESDYYDKKYFFSLVENIYLVKPKNPNETKPLIVVDNNKKIDLKEFKETVGVWQSIRYKTDVPRMTYKFHIDKTIKMKFVNQLKKVLAESGGRKIAYAVIPKNPEYDVRYYKHFFIGYSITDFANAKTINEEINNFRNVINVSQLSSGECYINNNIVEDSRKIKHIVRELMLNEPDYIIKFLVNDNVDFSQYFKVVSSLKGVIYDLREEYSRETYLKPFIQLNRLEKEEVQQKYPFRMLELPSDCNKTAY